ncbi:MAG: hypothetical protein GY835_28045 [bacterium]|nr:hypothetical protein [bacterium]
MRWYNKLWKWLASNVDPGIAFVIAVIGAMIGTFGTIDPNKLASLVLVTLTILAIGVVRDRRRRNVLSDRANALTVGLRELKSEFRAVKGQVASFAEDYLQPEADRLYVGFKQDTELVANAVESLELLQETGRLLSEDSQNRIVQFLKNGGAVRAIVTSPTPITLSRMGYRNHDLDPDGINRRASSFADHARGVMQRAGASGRNLEVRYIPYPISETMVIKDHKAQDPSLRALVVRHAGFRVTYSEKMDLYIMAAKSPQVYEHYVGAWNQYYYCASKALLITGAPRSGKTSLVQGLVEGHIPRQYRDQSPGDSTYYVVTKAIMDNDVRTGFSVSTSSSLNDKVFAIKQGSDYQVDESVWEQVMEEIRIAHNAGKALFIDEIGWMQLTVNGFEELIEEILDDKKATLFATISQDDSVHPAIGRIKAHPRTRINTMDSSGHEDLRQELIQEIDGTMWLQRCIERGQW